MTSLCIISDTHGRHNSVRIPPCDILIHCGDFTTDIGRKSLRDFLVWFERQPAIKAKLLISGNHDGATEKWPDLAAAMMKEVAPSVTYLQDSGCTIDGIKFWGSPVTPTFFNWYHMRDRGETIKRHWDMIPRDTDVVITHGPPRGILDWSDYGKEHGGCDDLLAAVKEIKPKIHCYGHFHGEYGTKQIDGIIFVNASLCNEKYKPVNAPWRFEL